MENKENGNKRPCYFCFRDKKTKRLFGLFQYPLNMKNIKRSMNIKNKDNIEYIISFLERLLERKQFF